MNIKNIEQEFLIAKESYDKLRRKHYGEIHDQSCTLNKDPTYKLIDHNSKANASNLLTYNGNNLEKHKWKLRGKEDDEDNCCLKNTPCPLLDFQLEKIKQLAESGRPWMDKNWDKIITNSNDSKETNHGFRTYFTNQKLSILSPNHKIQLYRVGTFSNGPSYVDELQSDIYDSKLYLDKFKTFEHFSEDIPQFYGGNMRMCRPLEFGLPCTSKVEMTMKYQDLIHRISLPELKENNEIKDDSLEFKKEYENENDLSSLQSSQIDESINAINLSNTRGSSKGHEMNRNLKLQLQNFNSSNQNLKTLKEDDHVR